MQSARWTGKCCDWWSRVTPNGWSHDGPTGPRATASRPFVDGGRKRRRRNRVAAAQNGSAQPCRSHPPSERGTGLHSDIDVLTDFKPGATQGIGFRFFGYGEELAGILCRKVDFCSRLDPRVEPIIRREAVTIYEDS